MGLYVFINMDESQSTVWSVNDEWYIQHALEAVDRSISISYFKYLTEWLLALYSFLLNLE